MVHTAGAVAHKRQGKPLHINAGGIKGSTVRRQKGASRTEQRCNGGNGGSR